MWPMEMLATWTARMSPTDASVAGLMLGVVCAFILALWPALTKRRTSSGKNAVVACGVAVPAPRISRQTRAAKLLAAIAESNPGRSFEGVPSSASATSAAGDAPDGAASEEEEWKTDSEDTSGSSSDEEEIPDSEVSEYDRMEAMRLKMVFVVRQFVPKMETHTVAELTAGAGVGLIEWHNALPMPGQAVELCSSTQSTFAAHGCLVDPNAEEMREWQTWYAWWNRIGCAKIALKCSEEEVMEAVVAAARKKRLPLYLMRRSHVASQAPQMAKRSPVKRPKRTPDGVPALMELGREGPNAVESGKDDTVVVVLGPAPADSLDPITGKLKLFN